MKHGSSENCSVVYYRFNSGYSVAKCVKIRRGDYWMLMKAKRYLKVETL